MKSLLTAIIIFVFLSENSSAQMPEAVNASDILLRMKKLQVLGSVLYIAAHPDDENTRLLAWLSKDKLYRTGYLSLTRGDGGQNLIGDEQGIELGLIRTQELLAARRVDGAEQFFSRAYDFGFSKTTAESLKFWDQQKMLADVVWIIRKFQPDIIITRFPEDKRAGHGQHSASSVLAHLAYSAAADPKQFPEQFTFGVGPWQARRLFFNAYRFGNFSTVKEDQLKIEVGGYNALLGKSYGELAADSRSQHKSQGFGVSHSRGNATEYFSLTEGEKADSSLMQNINCSWQRIPDGAVVGQMIDQLILDYHVQEPYQSIPALVGIYKKMSGLKPGYWKDKKLKELVEIIQACAGLWLEATVNAPYAVKNLTIPVTLQVVNRSPLEIRLQSVNLNKQDTSFEQSLLPGVNYTYLRNTSLQGLAISQPYWLVDNMSAGSYNVQDQTLIGLPQNPPALVAVFTIRISGELFTFQQPVIFKSTDDVKGETYQPLTIIPSVMAYPNPELVVFNDTTEKHLNVSLVTAPDSILEVKEKYLKSIALTKVPGFQIKNSPSAPNEHHYLLKSVIHTNQADGIWVTRVLDGSLDTLVQKRTITYDHIPRIDYFKPSKSTLLSVDLKTAGKRIGYVDGAGDKVPDALQAMGYTVVKLNENSLTASSLQELDAVITGVRAYDVHDWLWGKHEILMDYVKNGGNLIVQYNRNLGDDTTGIGPYPFKITNFRVTEEDAAVRFLQPSHPVLHFPNEITDKDFQGWIQERGIYFVQRADPRYQHIFSMHDAEDSMKPEQNGSLIIGTYGKGYFVYNCLVFFRELPAAVPGSYRLLANMIALNQQKKK